MGNLIDTLQLLDAGIFADKANEALKMAALGVIQTGKKGSVTIILELDQIGDSTSVQVKHTLKYCKPTKNGKASEENATSTPMYINMDGSMTINSKTQTDLFSAEKPNKSNTVTPIGERNG